MLDLTRALQFWTMYGDAIVLTVGTVTVAIGAVLGWRWWRHGEAHQRTGTLAVVLATLFSAEGMWEVARGALNLEPYIALVLFAMFEVVMVNQGLLAKHKLAKQQPGAHRHMRFVWLIAFITGGIASTNSDNLTEFCLRLAAPSVAAGIWWTTLTADGNAKPKSAVTFRWSPRRLALWLGIIEPGENDVHDVDRARRLDQLVNLVRRRQNGKLSARSARRLSRLEWSADDAMLDEVIRRMDRSVWFRTTLDTPVPPPPATPGTVPAPPAVYPPVPVLRANGTPPAEGSGTPAPAPLDGASTPTAAPLAARFSTPLQAVPAPHPNNTPAPALTSDGTPDGTPGDAEHLAVLRDPHRVPREGDGTVPIKRAMRVLGTGRDRAIRLLKPEGLLRVPDPDDGSGTPDSTPGPDGSGTGADDEDRHPAALINSRRRDLAAIGA